MRPDEPVRPATPADAALLVAWLGEPDVHRFWGGRPITAEEAAELCRAIDEPEGERVARYIILSDGRPVGYLQAWRAAGMRGGLDLFVATAERRRGIATRALRFVAERCLREEGWLRVTVDPDPRNARAIAAFEGAGFVAAERTADEDGEHLIMEYRGTPAP